MRRGKKSIERQRLSLISFMPAHLQRYELRRFQRAALWQRGRLSGRPVCSKMRERAASEARCVNSQKGPRSKSAELKEFCLSDGREFMQARGDYRLFQEEKNNKTRVKFGQSRGLRPVQEARSRAHVFVDRV